MNIKRMLLDNSPGKWISKGWLIRKSNILSFVLVLGFVFCFTNGFAFGDGEGKDVDDGVAIPEGGLEFQRVPNFIFGSRDFEKMRDLPTNSQDYQLGRKVAYLQIWVKFLGIKIEGKGCTGFLVGPDLLMTNRHCLYNEQTDRQYRIEDIEVYMDYYQEPEDDRRRGGITAGVLAVLEDDKPKDYALLRLDARIGDTYGWLELDATTTTDTSQSVKIIHHSAGRPKEISRRNSQIVDRRVAPYHEYDLAYLADVEPGSSGAPVFLRDETRVIAINKAGRYNDTNGNRRHDPGETEFYNVGTLMSYIVPEIQRWLPSAPSPNLVDINGDGQVSVLDLVLVAVYYGTRRAGLRADVNTDGVVNVQDFELVAAGVDAAADALPQQTVEAVLLAAAEQAAEIEAVAGGPVRFSAPVLIPDTTAPPNLMDVNRDGRVNVLDLVLVAVYYGTRRAGLRADVNTDGVVNVQDFELVAAGVDAAADALPQQTVEAVLLAAAEQVAEIEAVAGGPMGFSMLQHVSIPDTTTLLPNYPNPFNPETWIPYQLAEDSKVTVQIYDAKGVLVRILPLGSQRAGLYYSRNRAAHWDGKNAQDEPVASGVYFYTLKAGDFAATRKMLIRK